MELRHLATFHLVAKNLNFTRTAAERHLAQSTITAQIQALESELGVPLFDRLGRRVALTEAGRRLLPYAERLLGLAAEAQAAVSEPADGAGTVTFTAAESVCTYRLPELFRAVRAQSPLIQLIFRPLPCAAMPRAVRTGAIDLAFLLDEPRQVDGLAIETLFEEELLLLAPPEHRLAGRPAVYPTDLRDEPMLLTETGCSYRTHFVRQLDAAGVQPTTLLDLGSIEAIKQCVLAGMGLTMLPAMTVSDELAQGRLVQLAWAGATMPLASQLAWNRRRWQPAAVRSLIQLIGALWPSITPGTPAQHRSLLPVP